MTTATVQPEFEAFKSIPRLSRDMVVTEKIDGTNGQIYIADDGLVIAGSRNQWLGLEKGQDPFGFARWVKQNEDELRAGLGPGRHYGEWWGAGIQRKYGLSEKRFSLFNAGRWSDDPADRGLDPGTGQPRGPRPACCHVVPVLYRGPFDVAAVDQVIQRLAQDGSRAAPGFMKPEGVVVFHVQGSVRFKKTLGNDGHKGGDR